MTYHDISKLTRTILLLATVTIRKQHGTVFRTVAACHALVGVAGGVITRDRAATILVDLAVLACWWVNYMETECLWFLLLKPQ